MGGDVVGHTDLAEPAVALERVVAPAVGAQRGDQRDAGPRAPPPEWSPEPIRRIGVVGEEEQRGRADALLLRGLEQPVSHRIGDVGGQRLPRREVQPGMERPEPAEGHQHHGIGRLEAEHQRRRGQQILRAAGGEDEGSSGHVYDHHRTGTDRHFTSRRRAGRWRRPGTCVSLPGRAVTGVTPGAALS